MTNKKFDLSRFAPQPGRKTAFRNERKYYLIVCEGEKTEPNYFAGLKNELPPGVLSNYEINIKGEGRNTKSLVDKAIEIKEKLEANTIRKVDKVWVVFDKDSFSPQLFNAAIQSCSRRDFEIEAAWSNEAFELWYLLHFAYYDTAMSRDQYKAKLEEHIRKEIDPAFIYKKNLPGMFKLLDKYRAKAIRNAQRLKKSHKGINHATHNPCTTVHDLVIELFNLAAEK